MKHPAHAHHFDGAKDQEVIVQIIGYGPSSTTFIRRTMVLRVLRARADSSG